MLLFISGIILFIIGFHMGVIQQAYPKIVSILGGFISGFGLYLIMFSLRLI